MTRFPAFRLHPLASAIKTPTTEKQYSNRPVLQKTGGILRGSAGQKVITAGT
jgi:hypothetical protein